MTPNLRNMDHVEDMMKDVRITDHVEDIIKDDETAKDQNFVDDLISKEMLKLSVKDRNAIQEEIHGVKCLAVEETPELIEKSLKELTEEINNKIPNAQKRAYLKSLEPVNDNSNNASHSNSNSNAPISVSSSLKVVGSDRNENNHPSSHCPSSYIHGQDFRLRFLRCDLFDVQKAARRLVTYLDMLVELFGDYALRRPICLSDFTKEELRHFRKGMIQILPYRDRTGRRILIAFPEEEVSQIPPFVKAKIAMYLLWAAGDNDVVTQKLGVIVLAWYDASFAKLSTSWKIKYKFYTLNCDRITAIHCCSPDTPHYRFRRSIMVMRVGVENRSKLIFHLGESMEIHYKLQGYGIPFEHVPISWTGKVKVQYLKQWMRVRQTIEHHGVHSNNNIGSDGSSDESVSSNNNIIECPQLQDVVFRQGTSGTSHPGNVTFRSLIESHVVKEAIEQYRREQAKQQEQTNAKGGNKTGSSCSNHKKSKAKRPKQLALEIYNEQHNAKNSIKGDSNTGRFLIWNNEKGWWNELTDKEQICMKIEYMVREFQKNSQKHHGKKKPGASSSSRKTHHSDEGSPHYSPTHNSYEDGSVPTKNVIYLQSGTWMFRSQDGGNSNAPFFANKRQRLNFLDSGSNGTNSAGNDDDNCFGMKFTPCLT